MTLPVKPPAVLLIGAGQVAVVFAHHLAQAGARIGFLVKPQHEAAVRRGFVLYSLRRPRRQRWQPSQLPPSAFECLTTPARAAETPWDYVLLTQPSSGLRGAWFDELVAACPHAVLVTFQLGLGDREWISQRVPASRVMSGMLALASYAAPIANEPITTPGTAYWTPPGVALPFSGPDRAAVAALAATFTAGGLPAKATADGGGSRLPDFVLLALISALWLCDWKFAMLRTRPEQVRLAIAAAKEASAVDEHRLGTRRPLSYAFIRPASLWLVLTVARWLLPLPLEAFLRVHFTKIEEQVRRDRRLYLTAAQELKLSSSALAQLDRALTQAV